MCGTISALQVNSLSRNVLAFLFLFFFSSILFFIIPLLLMIFGKAVDACHPKNQRMSQASSAAWQNLLQATLALRLKLLILMVSSLKESAKSS